MSTKAQQDALIASALAGGVQKRTPETAHYPDGWFEEPLFVVRARYLKIHHRILEEPIANDPAALARFVRLLADRRTAELRGRRGYINPAVWLPILEAFGHRCAYCGRGDVPLEKDHRIAVTRGGTDDPDNLVPACKPCNVRKYNHPPEDWPLVVQPVLDA